jgi:hypothetical protein
LAAVLAEGAGFEPAVHEVDAGFQDRWFQPLTHPSDKEFNYLRASLFGGRICVATMLQNPKRFCNVGALQMDVVLMHLRAYVAGG